MMKLIAFRTKKRTINIPQEITEYDNFGILLLEDRTEARVKAIREFKQNAEGINREVLVQWIQGRGKQPVSWRTLIEVLHDIGLDELGRDIEAALA